MPSLDSHDGDPTTHFTASRNAKATRRKHAHRTAGTHPPSSAVDTGLFTPPSSQSQAEMDARRMLISPPPEELLRRNRTAAGRPSITAQLLGESSTKRKRQTGATSTINHTRASSIDAGGPAAPEATPNSKPRKQSKRHLESIPRPGLSPSASPSKRAPLLSPHHANPHADFLPPTPSHRRARPRSTTPVRPYEPPAERFTPPREVLCSPLVSPTKARAHRRKSTPGPQNAKAKAKVKVKKEPPVIDLSAPLPPPSPTDDPLLLSAPPRTRRPRRAWGEGRVAGVLRGLQLDPFGEGGSGSAHSYARETPLLSSSPPRREEDGEALLPQLTMRSAGADFGLSDADEDDGRPAPAFAFDVGDAADDGWTDDEEMEAEGEGEYTGRFREVVRPIMADPPSSCTRMRIEAWGRPKSPHPRLAALVEGLEDGEDEEEAEEVQGAVEAQDDVFSAGLLNEVEAPAMATSAEFQETEAVEEDVPDEVDMGEDEEPDALEAVGAAGAPSSSSPPPRPRELSPTPPPPQDEDEAELVETSAGPIPAEEPEPDADDGRATPPYADSRTPSASPVELRAAPSPAYYDYDVPMDDSSDQDTLTEPDADDDFVARLQAKGEAAVSCVPFSLDGASSSTAGPPEVRELPAWEEEGVLETSPAGASESVQDPDASLEEEEDLWDEATVDRELSLAPEDCSEDEAEEQERAPTPRMPTFELSEDAPARASSPASEARLEVEDARDDAADSGDESEALDDGVIKITSDDPLAAARAAAILRLHDYDCLPHVPAKARKRRRSTLDADAAMRAARRRSSLAAGISKAAASTPHPARRHTLGGMLGDKVLLPGSPALTIPELLDEAERSLDLGTVRSPAAPALAFVTPSKPGDSFSFGWATPEMEGSFVGEAAASGAWTRREWKTLDSCLTDERLALGGDGGLADVGAVDLERVVERFFVMVRELESGGEWSREDVLRRARALQKKQQRGKVAPPTPSVASMLPRTPTAPASDGSMAEEHSSSEMSSVTLTEHPLQPQKSSSSGIPRSTLANRVKGFFFSYLPVASTSKAQPAKKPQPAKPGLPLPIPPPETFAKPRAPIHTPAPKLVPKPIPPKNTVNLNAVPPPKPSRIPRSKEPPRRLVELHPLPRPPTEKAALMDPAGGRRDSGGSVKDLIMAFEGLSQSQSRPSSVASLRGGSQLRERPIWRP